MALTLPRAGAGTVGSGPGRGLRRLPGAGDVPKVEPARDPGLQIPDQGAVGRGISDLAVGAADLVKGIEDRDARLDAEVERQQKLHDANKTTDALLSFEKDSAEDFRRRQVEDDPGRDGFLDDFEADLGTRLEQGIASLEGVSPEAADRARQRMQGSLQATVSAAGRVSLQAGQARASDSINGIVNAAAKQAGAVPELLDDILDDAADRLGEYAGALTPDAERNELAGARSNIILSAVGGLVRGQRFAEARAVLSSGDFDADLSPAQRSAALAMVDAGERQVEAERSRNARQAVSDAVTVLRYGKVPADLDAVKAMAAGTDFAAPLAAAVEDAETMGEFVTQPLAEQGRRLNEFSKQETATARDVTLASSMARANAGLQQAIAQGNGIAVAAEVGVIVDLAPVSFDDPLSLQARAAQADIASEWAGQPVSPFSAGEQDQLEQSFDVASPSEVTGLLMGLSEGLGRDQAVSLAGAIAPKRPELAVAIAMAEDLPEMSRDIVLGGRILRENPEAKANKAQHIEALTAVAGNLFTPESAGVMDDFLAAADALYANQFAAGEFVFNPDGYEESLRTVMGNPLDFNGRTVLPPVPGMSEDAFATLMDRMTQPDLIEFGNGVPLAGADPFTVDMFGDSFFHNGAELVTVGPGRYAVNLPGLGTVMTETGVYVLDLRKFLEQ